MANMNIAYLLVLCLLHFTLINCDDTYFVLRDRSTDLVLDRSEGCVTLQKFTGFSSQLWTFEPTKEGKSYIVSKHDGKVLDIDSRYKVDVSWIVVNKKVNGTPSDRCGAKQIGNFCQLWYVHYEGSIVNGCGNGTIALTAGFWTGAPVSTKRERGYRTINFAFQYM